MALCILTAMLIFPVHLFAQEATETVEHEAGFYYTVKKGDTLWDLSTQFSDNPWLWPNLW
ncbi:MAG: LysM peptidoglycan-binding domain-containing protein, partial [Proteobacteria bacterium]|nr:LysM peptidoglycan-binding domain-containing protein [Pseudomonadota bacterium]